jgi:hypothetical protein
MDKSSSSRIYTPVNSHKGEIRLVTIKSGTQPEPIRCNLSYVSLNDKPEYEALSYVWGVPSTPISILLDEHTFGVTQNLGLALRFLRLPTDDRTLWIDAICVNQDDLDERSAQVQLMKSIYQDAHQVVSWLGDEDENAAYADWFISQAIDQDFSTEWLITQLVENVDMHKALLHLSLHLSEEMQSYWGRLWIMQEIAFAQDGILRCGDTIIPYWAVQRLMLSLPPNVIHQDKLRQEVLSQRGTQGLDMLSGIFHTIRQNEVSTKLVPGMPLLELLRKNRWKLASDPRDKVFGLLGLSDLSSSTHPGLKIDYNRTVGDVYIGVFQAIVDTASKLDILCFSIPVATQWNPETILGTSQTVLPSWVPDWNTSVPSFESCMYNTLGSSAAGDTPASVEFRSDKGILCAAGICIGMVKKCAAPMPARQTLANSEHELFHAVLGDVLEWRGLLLEMPGDLSTLDSDFLNTITLGAAEVNSDLVNALQPFDTSGGSTHFLSGLIDRLDDIRTVTRESMLLKIQRSCGNNVFFLIETSISSPLVTDATIPLMGAGRSGIREGDMICVFLGCNFPVAIRPNGDHYIFIGAVYVNNLTDGEAIADLENGLYELDCFELR